MAKALRSATEDFIAANDEVIEQQEKINEKTEQDAPKMGQPRKYNEPTKHISFSVPVSVIENLRILAALKKTNQTQIILKLINDEITKNANKIVAYKKLLG